MSNIEFIWDKRGGIYLQNSKYYSEMISSISEKTNISALVKKIKSKKINHDDLPEPVKNHKEIAIVERQHNMRNIVSCGYDCIRGNFYVNETIQLFVDYADEDDVSVLFHSFEEYYYYLGGNIYTNSTYFNYEFSNELISKFNIDTDKLNFKSIFHKNIDDFSLEPNSEELKEKLEQEINFKKVFKKRIEWVNKIIQTTTYEDFNKTMHSLMRTQWFESFDTSTYFKNKILFDIDEQHMLFLLQFHFDTGRFYLSDEDFYAIFYFYNKVDFYIKFYLKEYEKSSKKFIETTQNLTVVNVYKGYNDSLKVYYIEKRISDNENINFSIIKYFNFFEEFATELGNDFSDCNLLNAPLIEFDNTKFIKNTETILPPSLCHSRKLLKKYYDYINDEYVVEQSFLDENNHVLKSKEDRFEYFIDFLHYINYDLSLTNLIMCDGLANVQSLERYNISSAYIKSDIYKKYNLPISSYDFSLLDFQKELQINNEESSLDIYNINRNTTDLSIFDNDFKGIKIGYISDIHLEHRLKNEKIITENDLNYHLFKIANKIVADCHEFDIEYLIITGDVTYKIDLFEKFIEFLYIANKRRRPNYSFLKRRNIRHQFIFTLGNHELWQFSNLAINQIIDGYRNILEKYNMYLLHNEILYLKNGVLKYLSSEEILSDNFIYLCKNDLNLCNMVLFGGIGFSGLNEDFNANNRIYRDTITRNQEIEESSKFNELYRRIATYLKKEVIIASHMPLKDWSNETYNENLIYVSGHTHRNVFMDDGKVRIYSDNQVGYKGKTVGIKFFYIDDNYDYFNYYSDGIYNITKKDYIEFYYGKKQRFSFNWTPNKLYMIKKNNFYMFLHESKSNLCLLIGGTLKKLDYKNVDYYYENMDKEIAMIKNPLDKFSKIQRTISNEVKKFGGEGTIHGAIIDISFSTHIYVNPYDLSLTYYWASNIINKSVYKSLSHLLEKREPKLYLAYKNLLEKNKSSLDLTIFNHNNLDSSKMVVTYLDTDIYKASLQIKKMQRLDNNVLAVWYPLDSLSKSIDSNSKELEQKLLKVKK